MRGRGLTFLALAAVTTLGSAASAQSLSDDEVFAQVFASSAKRAQLPVLLVVAGKKAGTIVVEQHDGGVRVGATAVLQALADAKVAATVRGALTTAARDQRLTTADFKRAGLEVELDLQRLELRIRIPAALAETTSHRLGSHGAPEEAATALRPSDVSGYVNARARTATDTASQLRLDGVLAMHRWVLEARTDLIEGIGPRRGDVLLSHDEPASAVRYLAGDFAIAGSGLQAGFPLLGIGVTRNFSLQPYRRIQPVGVFHFMLDAAATVTIVVNGAPVQTLQLQAGRHDVRDLPGMSGVSDVELLIRDSSGVERRIQFSSVNPGELLAPGVVQFSVGFGFPLVSETGMRDYAWQRPVLSTRRRWGVTDRMTLGLSSDADLERQVAGASIAVASTLGNVSFDANASRDEHLGRGTAASVRYDLARAAGNSTSTVMLAARAYSRSYRSLGVLDFDAAHRGDVSLAASTMLGYGVYGRVNLRYQVGRQAPDSNDTSLALTRSFDGLQLAATIGVRDSHLEQRDIRMFVTANWVLPGRRGFVQAASRTSSRSTPSNDLRITSAARPNGGLVASAGIRQQARVINGDGSLIYAHDRFTAAMSGGAGTDGDLAPQRTRMAAEVGTSLAFAGGQVAWSRPIDGSFAIIDRHTALGDTKVGINPSAGGYAARSDGLGPVVVRGFAPYRVGALRFDAPELQVGRSLGATKQWILPTYKSGTLVTVGEAGSIYLRGTLSHRDGSPASLVVGELVTSTGPQTSFSCSGDLDHLHWTDRVDCLSEVINQPSVAQKSWVVMTNRAGRFSVVGVTPGRYELKLPDARPITVIIPAGHTGVYSTGTLEIE